MVAESESETHVYTKRRLLPGNAAHVYTLHRGGARTLRAHRIK